jgi:hypothetical protein
MGRGGAALINTHWLLAGPEFRSCLRAGYYLWLISFVLLALALHWTQREGLNAATTPSG